MILKILGAFIVWFFFGTIINIVFGWISNKILAKYYQNKTEMERDLTIRNMQEGCREPTTGDLIFNAIFWPRTIYYAIKGHIRIKHDMEKKP